MKKLILSLLLVTVFLGLSLNASADIPWKWIGNHVYAGYSYNSDSGNYSYHIGITQPKTTYSVGYHAYSYYNAPSPSIRSQTYSYPSNYHYSYSNYYPGNYHSSYRPYSYPYNCIYVSNAAPYTGFSQYNSGYYKCA